MPSENATKRNRFTILILSDADLLNLPLLTQRTFSSGISFLKVMLSNIPDDNLGSLNVIGS